MEFNNNKGEYLFPYEIKWVEPEVNRDLLKNFTGERINKLSTISKCNGADPIYL